MWIAPVAFAAALALTPSMRCQEATSPGSPNHDTDAAATSSTGIVSDLSHHHVVYSRPAAANGAQRNGTYDGWLRITSAPRSTLQQLKRSGAEPSLRSAPGDAESTPNSDIPDDSGGPELQSKVTEFCNNGDNACQATQSMDYLFLSVPGFGAQFATNPCQSASLSNGCIMGVTTSSSCAQNLAIGNFTLCGEVYKDVSTAENVTVDYSPSPNNAIIAWATWCFTSSCNTSIPGITATIGDNINATESCFVASPHSPFITDGNGGAQGSGDFQQHYVWYCPSIPSGVTSFTVTPTNPNLSYLQLNITEWKAGSLAPSCSPISACLENVDNPGQAGNSTGGTTATITTSGPTANANDLIFVVTEVPCCSFTASPGTGYTGITMAPAVTPGMVSEAKAATNAGIQAATSTWTGGSTSWFGVIVPVIGAKAATVTINWTPATTITYGSAGANVLDATASCGSSCGSFTYTATASGGSPMSITSTSDLAGGTYTITADFTPSNPNQYSANSATSTLMVTSCANPNPNPNPNPASFANPGDFNGDCRSDILWRNSGSEEVYTWLMDGIAIASQGGSGEPSSAWVIQGVADFNGDGKADILWQNSTTGEVYVWLMNGTSIASQGTPGTVSPSSGWVIAGVGDFNGNGTSDILWRNTTSGEVYLWLMNGTTIASQGEVGAVSPSSGWNIVGVGDFNGDGKADILWQNSTSGEVYIWLMSGTTIASQGTPATVSPSSGWSIAGAGDFDGNGTSDILWRNTTSGEVYIWLMNGTTITSRGSPGTVSSAWSIQGVGDYNGDGKADVLWRNTSGEVYVWEMDGLTIASQGSPGTASSPWQISPLVSP